MNRFEAGPRISVSRPSQADLPSGGSLDFGAVAVGTSGQMDLVIRNSGSSTLQIGTVEVTGEGFAPSAMVSASVPPGGMTPVTLDFTPEVSGGVSGVLRISSDADNQPSYEISLVGTGNLAPVFGGYSVSIGYQTASLIAGVKLLARASDSEGDAISIQNCDPVSSEGGSVVVQAGGLLYTPPLGFTGNDSFSVTLVDARGAETVGTISVTVGPVPTAGGITTNPPKLTPLAGGGMAIHFQGIPSRSYGIQRSTNMNLWVTIATVTADAAGAMDYTDPAPPQPTAFYRLALP